MKKTMLLSSLTLAALLFIHPQVVAQENPHNQHSLQSYQTYLSQGHQFFSTQNYQEALNAYEESYAIEPLDSTLHNIAVSYFKLKNWQQALEHFEELKRYQGSANLVEYNIALTHKKLGQQKQALFIFSELMASAEDDKIAKLAEQQIAKITDANTSNTQNTKSTYATDKPQWQNMLAVQYGKDNNIVLPDDDENLDVGDKYVDLSFNSTWMSSSDLSNAWMADFTYFKSTYNEASDYNIDLYALSGRKYFTPASIINTRFWLGLGYNNINLAGNNYINNTTFTLGSEYKFNTKQKVTLEFSRKNISEGEQQYGYLAGNTNRIKLTWRHITDNGYWRTGLKYYMDNRNDRISEYTNDSQTFNAFTSYSANRTTLFVNRSWHLNSWEFSTDLQYRYSAFKGNNTAITFDDSDLPSSINSLGTRSDHRYNVLLELSYNITDDLSIGGEVDLSSNTSTIENYDYNQSSFAVGVNWMF